MNRRGFMKTVFGIVGAAFCPGLLTKKKTAPSVQTLREWAKTNRVEFVCPIPDERDLFLDSLGQPYSETPEYKLGTTKVVNGITYRYIKMVKNIS